jgi:16S rRNA U1498 N3-methylase RsmE
VGPEGDWARFECETLSAGGFTAVSLGRRIMKSPTAVAVGLGFLSMRLEQYYEN